MGRPIMPIGPTRTHASDKLGQFMVSQIGPEAIGPGSRPGPGRPIPILNQKSPPYNRSSHIRSSHHETPKLLESFQQKREGIILKKRVENERRKSHSPKELQTRSSNKRPNSLSKHESISLHLFDIPQDQNLVKFQSFSDHHSARQYR